MNHDQSVIQDNPYGLGLKNTLLEPEYFQVGMVSRLQTFKVCNNLESHSDSSQELGHEPTEHADTGPNDVFRKTQLLPAICYRYHCPHMEASKKPAEARLEA